jgi:hypothetical protein
VLRGLSCHMGRLVMLTFKLVMADIFSKCSPTSFMPYYCCPRSKHIYLRAGLDLESGLKNGLGCKKSTPLTGREFGTCLFKFTP